MATLWVLLLSTIICVAHPAYATPVSSRVVRSSAADHCFDELTVSCHKVLPPHSSLPGLENPTSNNWYHCQCTNKLNKCIRDALGPFTIDSEDPAYDMYDSVTGYLCYRESRGSQNGTVYERVRAPLNNPDIPIYS